MSTKARGLTRRQFFEVSAASAAFISCQKEVIGSQPPLGLDSIRDKNPTIKIWPDEQKQTIGFELPELPREVFKIVIPELVSDAEEPIIPWEHPSPKWDIDENSARWSTEIHDMV